MRKRLLVTLMLVFVCGAVISSPIHRQAKQAASSSEMKHLLQAFGNPADARTLGLEMISSLKSHYDGSKNRQTITSTKTEEIQKTWDGSQWVNSTKYEYMYDENGVEYESYTYMWNASTERWDYTWWQVNTNNAAGLPEIQILKMWDGSAWSDFIKITYTYTSFGQPQEILGALYFGVWMDITKTIYSYNNLEQCTEIVNQEFDFVSTWNNTTRDSLVYNANGWMTEDLAQQWDSIAWVNNTITYPAYDNNGHDTAQLQMAWVNNAWENSIHSTYSYNQQWLVILEHQEIWINNAWGNSELYTNQYDAQNRISEVLFQEWGGTSWNNSTLTNWTYDLTVGLQPAPLYSQALSVYPNPAKDKITVEITKLTGSELISIYNSQGQIVIQKPVQQLKTEIGISNLSKGIYFVKLGNKEGLNQKVFIKE